MTPIILDFDSGTLISTHILTKRMTPLGKQNIMILRNFNSHPHEEDDSIEILFCVMRFISTHILTKRMTQVLTISGAYSPFQLTSSRRGWRSHNFKNTYGRISTHILTKRMTTSINVSSSCFVISTHILTKRMTFFLFYVWVVWVISTHILTKRMTKSVKARTTGKVFQLTSSRRGWLITFTFNCSTLIFQLTSSRRGWQLSQL